MNFSINKNHSQNTAEKSQSATKLSLKKGYLEMSQINQRLAEEGVASDNEALLTSEQNLRSVKNK